MKSKNPTSIFVMLLGLAAFVSTVSVTTVAQSGTWTTKPSMPSPRAYFASCSAGNTLYAFGGYDGAHLDTVIAYDTDTGVWSSKALMPVARTSAQAVEAGGKIYVLGGFINNATTLTTRVDVYDPATDSWGAPVAPMPTLRTTFGVGVIDGIIYAVGGANNSGNLATVEAYDPGSDTWEAKTSMPTPQNYPAVDVIGGLLYAAGSADGNVSFVAYDPSSDTWDSKPSLPTARFIPGAGVLGGRLYVVGGATSNTLNIVEIYDPSTNSWSAGPAMPTDRYGLGVGVIGGTLYAFGGATFTGGFAVLSTVEALSLEEEAGPKELTLDLVNVVRSFTLQRGISNSFESKLQKVITALDSPNGTAEACDQLKAFINHANAQSGKHLTVAQADQLVVAASEIRALLGCE